MITNKNSNKKNILFLHAGAELYGADKVLLELIEGITFTEYNPIVILPNDGPLVKELERKEIDVRIINYPILRRKYFNFKGIFSYGINYIKYSNIISKIIDEEKIKIVHVNTTAVLEGVLLKLKNKVKIIWHVHEIIVRPKFINTFLCFLLGKFADTVIVVSNAVKEHLLKSRFLNSENVKIIYNGVPIISEKNLDTLHQESLKLRESLNIGENEIIIGMIGRINSWKGQSDFLRAIEKSLSKNESCYAVMIGGVFEGEEWRKQLLEKEVSENIFKDRIRIIDFQKNILAYHKMIDLFVLPSTNPDPLPTVVLESMSVGNAIVGYAHGGIIEMVANPQESLVKPNEIIDLGDKIFSYLNDPLLCSKAGKSNLRRQKKIFNSKNYTDRFIEIYRQY